MQIMNENTDGEVCKVSISKESAMDNTSQSLFHWNRIGRNNTSAWRRCMRWNATTHGLGVSEDEDEHRVH